MATGKLYKSGSAEVVGTVDYRFYDESEVNWWGELVLTEYARLDEAASYVIELQDGRKGKCSLRKRVNRAVSGVPPLYRYQFRGRGRLE